MKKQPCPGSGVGGRFRLPTSKAGLYRAAGSSRNPLRRSLGQLGLLVAFLATAGHLPASAGDAAWQLGPELQLYPAGAIPGLQFRRDVGERQAVFFRGAYNFTDRSDFGEHDDETGGGPGVTVGLRRYLETGRRGWSFGGRLDVWFMEIDWEDSPGTATQRNGTTRMTVIQPTAEAAYGRPVGETAWSFEATLSLGAEINVDVRGEEVGEGAILLGGVNFLHRF